LGAAPLDFVHVHEPFAPGASSAALRHSRSLNVGSFHAPTERLLSTQLGRRVVELFFGRLDARTSSYEATAELMREFFPADYQVITPGAGVVSSPRARSEGAVHIALVAGEERAAPRLFLRALRRLPPEANWRATVWSPRGPAPPAALRRDVRERVDFTGPEDGSEDELLATADVAAFASDGVAPTPGVLLRAVAAGAVPVTDHNEISGAQDALAKADGVKVIVAEEVKTASQGEVIGLFLSEKIARGMTLAETIVEIKRQGGLVYVPHPFDRLHSVPDYPHLLDVLEDVDAIEVFNPRVAISSFNQEAVRFAEKYRIVCGAGSDAHVTAGLGSVRIRMRDFNGPEEFLEALRDADIIRKPASLVYVQALKFLQTKATPASARGAAQQRRAARATRRSRRAARHKSRCTGRDSGRPKRKARTCPPP